MNDSCALVIQDIRVKLLAEAQAQKSAFLRLHWVGSRRYHQRFVIALIIHCSIAGMNIPPVW
jgi:TRAP-type C4-dicarboxylate transport system permease large subunit